MTPEQRQLLIEDIVSHAPMALGLSSNTRANLEAMSDTDLSDFHGKLTSVQRYVAESGVERPDLSFKRAALAARRAERYKKLAALSEKETSKISPLTRHEVSLLHPIPKTMPNLHGGVDDSDIDLASILHVWNTFDRQRNPKLTKSMRDIVYSWIQDFGSKVLKNDNFHSPIHNAFEGPLHNEFNNYLELTADRVGREALRIFRNHVFHADINPSDSVHLYSSYLENLTSEALLPEFIGTTSGRMRETIAIDGLAKMRSFAVNYQPDLIISVSGGGKIIGDFIAVEAKLDQSRTRVLDCRGSQAKISGGWKSVRSYRRILLVDDIAGSCDSLCTAHERLADRFENGDIQMVAFASSLETREQFIEEGHGSVFVAHVGDKAVDVPWDRTGVYRDKTKNHVFGDGASIKLSVPKAQMRRVSESLLESSAQ